MLCTRMGTREGRNRSNKDCLTQSNIIYRQRLAIYRHLSSLQLRYVRPYVDFPPKRSNPRSCRARGRRLHFSIQASLEVKSFTRIRLWQNNYIPYSHFPLWFPCSVLPRLWEPWWKGNHANLVLVLAIYQAYIDST